MKNPLQKRYLRELKTDFSRYLVIFILLVISIGFVSGFEVADMSIIKAYNDSFVLNNVEDGHFSTERRLSESQKRLIEQNNISVYDLNYVEEKFDNNTVIRIFSKRNDVNRECLMDGRFPSTANEIAVDRMYAENNHLSVGDTLKDQKGNVYSVVGLVALSDYSTLFQNNSDLMFDAVQFGAGVVTADRFAMYDKESLTYNYAWKYDDSSIVGSEKEETAAKDLISHLNEVTVVKKFIPRYTNQAINFAGDDLGSDGAMMIVFLDIVIVIVAFVFAITAKDTVHHEANVIGTLRASGYTKNELVRHYMVLPVFVTVISAIVGNILGYTFFKDVCAEMYYGSYSLPTYTTLYNSDAFVKTTIMPSIIMIAITWLVLKRDLSYSPLQFLKHDLTRKKRKKAFPLKHSLSFITRFRMRVNFQNLSNYAVLFMGILFANILLMFGLALPDILHTYQTDIADNMLAKYQTILSVPDNAADENHRFESLLHFMQFSKAVETENEDAEKFSMYVLNTEEKENVKTDEVMLYGIQDNSRYVSLPGNGVYVSYLYSDKYDIKPGDKITLKEEHEDTAYTFTVDGITDYKGSISVFMPQQKLNETFHLGSDFFAGYFSDEVLEDIPEEYIGSVIDYDALTKVSRQLTVSMGSMMYLVDGFCVGMFVVLMYLMSKVIIERNAQSISMTKILGYTDKEINSLYIHSITVATLICLLITIPVCSVLLVQIYRVMLKQMMTGWMLLSIRPVIYVKMFVLAGVSYAAVALLEMKKIRKIPMEQALKNAE